MGVAPDHSGATLHPGNNALCDPGPRAPARDMAALLPERRRARAGCNRRSSDFPMPPQPLGTSPGSLASGPSEPIFGGRRVRETSTPQFPSLS